VLELLRREPGMAQRVIAEQAGWVGETGSPNKAKVNRLLKALKTDKLVTQQRGKWKLTDAGKRELEA
jgi:DNA-binding IclR family transcriptional regulator